MSNDILQRLKNLAEVKRHFENPLYADAVAEIERLRANFLQVHHNCIHARQVADRSLELLAAVTCHMPSSWRDALLEVQKLARTVPEQQRRGCSE